MSRWNEVDNNPIQAAMVVLPIVSRLIFVNVLQAFKCIPVQAGLLPTIVWLCNQPNVYQKVAEGQTQGQSSPPQVQAFYGYAHTKETRISVGSL